MSKTDKYLLGQEHVTDREIDELYNIAKELTAQLDQFRAYDAKYRALEEVSTQSSEAERNDLLNSCMLIMDKVPQLLKEMEEVSGRVTELFFKAKGALEEKLNN
jgi:hypothetical protein